MAERIGYIGLGLMGQPIARNLLKSGHEIIVHNRSRGPVEALVAEGAIEARSPREVAAQADYIFTNLPNSTVVELVVLGKEGVIEGVEEGNIFIDNSTIKPVTSRKLSKELSKVGVEALDAPVSGGDIGAIAGTLAIMIGGSESVYKKCLPLFESMGKTITYVGESGAGQVAKVCNQIMVASQMVAMGELMLLAAKCGVDPERVIMAIRGGAAQCWALDNKPQRLLGGERNPGFKAYMQYKDLGIVMDTARAYGMPLPLTALNHQLYESMLQLGMSELDNSAVIGVLEMLAGTSLTSYNG